MCIFGEIVNGVMHLNEAGHIVAWTWQALPNHVPNGIWDAFVVMPNPCAWYHHYHIPRPRRGGFGTRPYGTRIHGTRPYGTTICTQGRMCIFGEIVNGVMHLNEAGHIVAWTWQDLPNHVPNGIWDAFMVMPNPVHGIIIITSRIPVGAGSEPAPTEPAPTEPTSTKPAPTKSASTGHASMGPAPATKSYGPPEIVRQFKNLFCPLD